MFYNWKIEHLIRFRREISCFKIENLYIPMHVIYLLRSLFVLWLNRPRSIITDPYAVLTPFDPRAVIMESLLPMINMVRVTFHCTVTSDQLGNELDNVKVIYGWLLTQSERNLNCFCSHVTHVHVTNKHVRTCLRINYYEHIHWYTLRHEGHLPPPLWIRFYLIQFSNDPPVAQSLTKKFHL